MAQSRRYLGLDVPACGRHDVITGEASDPINSSAVDPEETGQSVTTRPREGPTSYSTQGFDQEAVVPFASAVGDPT
jgi:hypothetical protein